MIKKVIRDKKGQEIYVEYPNGNWYRYEYDDSKRYETITNRLNHEGHRSKYGVFLYDQLNFNYPKVSIIL